VGKGFLLGGLLVIVGCTALPTLTATPAGTPATVVTPTALPSAAMSPTVTPPFSPPPGWPPAPFTIAWSRAADPPRNFEAVNVSGTTHGFWLVGRGAAFESGDGSRWARPGGPADFGDATLTGATQIGSGFGTTIIVIGTRVRFAPGAAASSGAVQGLAWTPTDLGWRVVESGANLAGADLRRVVGIGEHVLAFGGYRPGEGPLGCDWGCVSGVGIWADWVPVVAEADPALQLTVPGPSITFGGNTVTGRPIVWRSADQLMWERVDGPPGLGGIPTAAWSTDACGDVLGASAGQTMYVSEDRGRTWRAAQGTKPALQGVIRLKGGWLGWNERPGSPDRGFWTSSDGFNWGPIDYFGRTEGTFGVTAMALSGPTLVAVGSEEDAGPFVATVEEWVEPPCLD
jgi:hypothetical protein